MSNIVIAYGDGVGPEIMDSVLTIMQSAKAQLSISVIEVGQKIYEGGWESGITDSSWDTLKNNKILLKSPITTPQGKGVKSLNVTIRKNLGLYANIRPCISYLDDERKVDLVIIRENEEDLYSGIEYRQTSDNYHSIKVITSAVCERICTYAFEYALANKRKRVTCMIKDNIMKMSDGIFHAKFDEVSKKYPMIEKDSYIIDIGCARIAKYPERFDVIVTLNLYGDIISDIAAEMVGSVGLAGSLNIGENFAMFEAVHGSAPDIAGKNIANPSGLLNAAIYMLNYLGQSSVAENVYNAWLKTIKSGIHTADIYKEGISKVKVGTKEFTKAIIDNLGSSSDFKSSAAFYNFLNIEKNIFIKEEKRKLVGVDICVYWMSNQLDMLVDKLKTFKLNTDLILSNIMIKGISIWPENLISMPMKTDSLCCRFISKNKEMISSDVTTLLQEFDKSSIEYLRIEKLYIFNEDKYGFFI